MQGGGGQQADQWPKRMTLDYGVGIGERLGEHPCKPSVVNGSRQVVVDLTKLQFFAIMIVKL